MGKAVKSDKRRLCVGGPLHGKRYCTPHKHIRTEFCVVDAHGPTIYALYHAWPPDSGEFLLHEYLVRAPKADVRRLFEDARAKGDHASV